MNWWLMQDKIKLNAKINNGKVKVEQEKLENSSLSTYEFENSSEDKSKKSNKKTFKNYKKRKSGCVVGLAHLQQ